MDTDEDYLPARFAIEIKTHVLSTLAGSRFGASQILLVIGEPGTGKTWNLFRVLSRAGVHVSTWDATEVESPNANQPVERLEGAIAQVRATIRTGRPAALVLDDTDLLLGRIAGTQYTHNLQHLVQHLMSVATGDPESMPCPIFFCANDPALLHAPLIRHGRAKKFHWEPDEAERFSMMHAHFPSLAEPDARAVFARFRQQPPAFFSALRQIATERYVRDELLSGDDTLLWRQAVAAANGQLKLPTYAVDVPAMIRLGAELLDAQAAMKLGLATSGPFSLGDDRRFVPASPSAHDPTAQPAGTGPDPRTHEDGVVHE